MDDFDTATNLINVYDVFGVCYPSSSSMQKEEMSLYQTKFLSL